MNKVEINELIPYPLNESTAKRINNETDEKDTGYRG